MHLEYQQNDPIMLREAIHNRHRRDSMATQNFIIRMITDSIFIMFPDNATQHGFRKQEERDGTS